MGLAQQSIEAWLGPPCRVGVLSVEGADGLLVSAVLALGLEAAGHTPVLIEPRPGIRGAPRIDPEDDGWAGGVAQWYVEQDSTAAIHGWDSASPLDELRLDRALVAGGARLLAGEPALLACARRLPVPSLGAVLGLGAEAAAGGDPDASEARLSALLAVGAVRGVELIARFDAAGRHFVELVELVHHRVGPEGQSTHADALRAALFGRRGDVPVNLASRDAPPRIGALTQLIFYVTLDEL